MKRLIERDQFQFLATVPWAMSNKKPQPPVVQVKRHQYIFCCILMKNPLQNLIGIPLGQVERRGGGGGKPLGFNQFPSSISFNTSDLSLLTRSTT